MWTTIKINIPGPLSEDDFKHHRLAADIWCESEEAVLVNRIKEDDGSYTFFIAVSENMDVDVSIDRLYDYFEGATIVELPGEETELENYRQGYHVLLVKDKADMMKSGNDYLLEEPHSLSIDRVLGCYVIADNPAHEVNYDIEKGSFLKGTLLFNVGSGTYMEEVIFVKTEEGEIVIDLEEFEKVL